MADLAFQAIVTILALAFFLPLIVGPIYAALIGIPYLVAAFFRGRRQRLLRQCKPRFAAAVESLERADTDAATLALLHIRELEQNAGWWNRPPIRVVGLLLAAGVAGVAGFFVLDFIVVVLGCVSGGCSLERTVAAFKQGWAEPFPIQYLMAIGGALCGGLYYSFVDVGFGADDFGDRLQRFIESPRGVSVDVDQSRSMYSLGGLTAHELMGLPAQFTRKALDKARRRLAAEFHPDRWHGASAADRAAAEAAMKLANAAYEELLPRAM